MKCENCCYFSASVNIAYEHCCFSEREHSDYEVAPCDYEEPNSGYEEY